MKTLAVLRDSVSRFFGRIGLHELFSISDAKRVSTSDALSLPAIWNGVSRISGHISQLPMVVYKTIWGDEDKIGGEKDRKHVAHWLLNRRPNDYQTPTVFRDQLSVHSLIEGNGRAAICRKGNRIMEIIPLDPSCTVTGMLEGVKYHLTQIGSDSPLRRYHSENDEDGSLYPGGYLLLKDEEVFHIPGLSTDGISGIPLKEIGRRNLRASISTEERFGNQMEKGFAGSLMLSAPNGVFKKQEEAEEFLNAFEKRHNSPKKAGKVGLLREGITANVVAMNNRDAELHQNRQFARQDQALWLGLEQILGDDSSVSYNSLEQKLLAYLMNCLNRWLKRWEEEAEYKLLSRRDFEAEKYYIRFNTAALLKSDYKTTVESLAQAIAATIISPNEARAKLDLNPRDGGDVFVNPAITPGTSADAPKPADKPAQPPTKKDRGSSLMITHLVGVEANRVKDGAAKAKNFIKWMDNYYKGFESKLADSLEALGLDRNEASVHCEESKRLLLEVCDRSQQSELSTNVAQCVSTWKSRANLIGELQNV